MAGRVRRGEIRLLHFSRPDTRRPVVVLSRPSLIQALHTVTVAAATSTRRGAPTEVDVGPEDGLKAPSCVNLCSVFTVRPDDLRTLVSTLGAEKMARICRALAIACDCD